MKLDELIDTLSESLVFSQIADDTYVNLEFNLVEILLIRCFINTKTNDQLKQELVEGFSEAGIFLPDDGVASIMNSMTDLYVNDLKSKIEIGSLKVKDKIHEAMGEYLDE